MRIIIKKPGLLSTIQDLGRLLYLNQAVPVSGAMDRLSARLANMLVGNADSDAVIEFTYGGAEFMTNTDVLVALSGDGAFLTINNAAVPLHRPVFIPAGVRVLLGTLSSGCRTYLAVAGGWQVPLVLSSRSTCLTAAFGGLKGRPLRENDELNSDDALSIASKHILDNLKGTGVNYPKWSIPPGAFLPATPGAVRITPGHEFSSFDGSSIINFLSQPYTLTPNCNRMGCHLAGVPLKRHVTTELLSTAVTPGTIQVTGSGSLIMLMADCQTTGGYPRIAKVAEVDLPICAQLKPGDTIHFKEISWNEAEMLYIEQEKAMHKLAATIKHKYATLLK